MTVSIKSLLDSLPFALLLGAIVGSQYYYDLQKKERSLSPLTIIPAQAVKIADLGLHSAAASALWVYTIQQVAEHPNKIAELIENVNEIDPKFSYPYAFAVLVLPDISGSPGQAIEIALVGIKNADPDWRLPYYLATVYHVFSKDREKAAFYFDLAARIPGAPSVVRSMPVRYGKYGTVREQTKQIWMSIYENSDDEFIKERMLGYLEQLNILELLEKAVVLYVQKYGSYPKKISDLVTGKILKEAPKSPIGLEFYLDEKGGVRY